MFKITREMLKAKGACAIGYREFCDAFTKAEYPYGVEYQEILDKCAENDRDSHARWLLSAFGKITDVKEIDGDYISEKSIFVCGSLRATGKISCKRYVEAGWGIEAGRGIEAGEGIKAGRGIEAGWGIEAGEGIEAGWGIKAGRGIEAGEGIKAGEGIEAGWGIEAGEDFGIYAGLRCRVNSNSRIVVAKEKPKNLMCGVFVGFKNDSE